MWPAVDPALLVEDEVTIAVQVQGKLRDTLTVPKGTDKATLERSRSRQRPMSSARSTARRQER